ncbi:hypothetical protein GCM10010182_07960 [Actinomadura cremea]|nr:hypothetical protein GCM10010182_07960 [Actinomadura cremea]
MEVMVASGRASIARACAIRSRSIAGGRPSRVPRLGGVQALAGAFDDEFADGLGRLRLQQVGGLGRQRAARGPGAIIGY